MIELAYLLAGVFYGLIIGIIPSAGASTGLIALFGFISYFAHEPYLGVIFLMAVVAASTTGDSFTAILLGPISQPAWAFCVPQLGAGGTENLILCRIVWA